MVGQTAEGFRRKAVGHAHRLLAMLVDQLERFLKRAGLLEQRANLLEHGGRRFALGDKLFELAAVVVLKPFERERPEHGRPAAQHVAAQRQLVEVVALPILQVVEDLERDAQVLGELCDGLGILIGRTGQPQAAVQRRFERRRRLQRVDLQRFGGRQPLVAAIAPHELGPLPFAQLRVSVGQLVEDVGGRRRRRARSMSRLTSR